MESRNSSLPKQSHPTSVRPNFEEYYGSVSIEADEGKLLGENGNISPRDFVKIQEDPLELQKLCDLVNDPEAGAISTFSGITRNNFDGKKVIRLEYEAYTPMAEKEMKKICTLIRNRWEVIGIAMVHRTGVVPIGESSVQIAVSSAHRRESLEAVQFAIDELKAKVPVWKKEVYEDNSHTWKENKECLHNHHGRE